MADIETTKTDIDKQLYALQPQLLHACTQTFPEMAPTVTLIFDVVCPEVIVQPAGTVHVYEVAPATAVIE